MRLPPVRKNRKSLFDPDPESYLGPKYTTKPTRKVF